MKQNCNNTTNNNNSNSIHIKNKLINYALPKSTQRPEELKDTPKLSGGFDNNSTS